MKRAAITDHGFPAIDIQKSVIEGAGFELQEIKPPCKTEEDVIQRCHGFNALLVQWAPITRKVMQALPEAQCIARYGIGVDNIDLDAARDLGRTVVNVPRFCLEEVSNHTLAMMLALARRIPHDHHQIRNGGWGIKPFLPIPALGELTLGLVGFGAIARRVCDKAQAFGLRIIASDPFVELAIFERHGASRVEMLELISTADIVSLHCPLLPSTKYLIRQETIQTMKRGAIVINTSRGQVIKEDDLVTALSSGRIVGAGLDVFEVEPLPGSSPLRALPNVILTSHAASVSDRARERLQSSAAESIRDFFLGKSPENAVV